MKLIFPRTSRAHRPYRAAVPDSARAAKPLMRWPTKSCCALAPTIVASSLIPRPCYTPRSLTLPSQPRLESPLSDDEDFQHSISHRAAARGSSPALMLVAGQFHETTLGVRSDAALMLLFTSSALFQACSSLEKTKDHSDVDRRKAAHAHPL